MRSGEDKPYYVIRKNVDNTLSEQDINNIVDDAVRELIQNAIAKGGKDALMVRYG